MQYFTFRYIQFKVNGLNGVGDTKRGECQDSTAIRSQIDWNIDETRACIWNAIVESFDERLIWIDFNNGLCPNERASFLPTDSWGERRVEPVDVRNR